MMADDIGVAESIRYLDIYLAPLVPFLAQDDVTDIFINRPGEVWIERLGGVPHRVAVPELGETALWRLARQVANLTHQGISREHPLLAATLPDGSRVQIVAPPATRCSMAIAIRKQVVENLRIDDYASRGALNHTSTEPVSLGGRPANVVPTGNAELLDYLRQAVLERRNIVISGGTSTGKTTFLNALVKEIPVDERLILIEDTPEVKLVHPNSVGLIAVKGELGEARITHDQLLQASLRMRPDRIILGELRGNEAYTFLRAANTGHPGSMTTIHADSPEGAIDQLALIILQSGVHLSKSDIVDYVRSVADLFVQLERVNGKRRIARVATVR
ncbi:MAG: P-type DNA transfer ATPase VirB11 [Myxococcota bacterium]|jgi:type IV secretion system protein VirB11